jgi:hypothetical protein
LDEIFLKELSKKLILLEIFAVYEPTFTIHILATLDSFDPSGQGEQTPYHILQACPLFEVQCQQT